MFTRKDDKPEMMGDKEKAGRERSGFGLDTPKPIKMPFGKCCNNPIGKINKAKK